MVSYKDLTKPATYVIYDQDRKMFSYEAVCLRERGWYKWRHNGHFKGIYVGLMYIMRDLMGIQQMEFFLLFKKERIPFVKNECKVTAIGIILKTSITLQT